MANTTTKRFLDQDGLAKVWAKIKENFVRKGELDTSVFIIVSELPTESIDKNKVYLVPSKEQGEDNKYIEYIYVDGAWEKMGEFVSEVKLTTEATKVTDNIPVAGGPLADLCNKAGITSINKDTNLQELLVSLFAKEIFPTPTFEEGTVQSIIAQPSFSVSNSASLVEVGTELSASACIAPTAVVNTTNRKYKGFDYGTSMNGQEILPMQIIEQKAELGTPGTIYGLVRTINGTAEAPVSGAEASLESKKFNVVEGDNSVKVEVTGPTREATFAEIRSLFIVSNFHKVSEDHKTEVKEAVTLTSNTPYNSKTIQFTGVYPLFATTASIGTLSKQPLQTSKEYIVQMVAESDADKQKFAIPASKTVAKIEMLNTLSGKYETYDLGKFTTKAEQQTVGDKAVSYTTYTRNDGKNGSATFKITLK